MEFVPNQQKTENTRYDQIYFGCLPQTVKCLPSAVVIANGRHPMFSRMHPKPSEIYLIFYDLAGSLSTSI